MYLLFKGGEGKELTRALSATNFQNFAVAVGRPIRPGRGEVVVESIPAAESFEVDMSTIGSRGTRGSSRRSKARSSMDSDGGRASTDRRSIRLPGLADGKTEF